MTDFLLLMNHLKEISFHKIIFKAYLSHLRAGALERAA